jgi:hypothetical protein
MRYGKEQYIRKEYEPVILAYMAGIVDGEGSISMGSYSKSAIGTPQFTTYLSICSTDKPLTDWLSNTFGIKPILYTPKQLAKNSRRPVWRWQVSGDRLLHICELILPYLIIKKRQAEIMIEMRKTFTTREYAIGQRGPKVPDEIMELRHKLVKELRSLHIRTSAIKHI